jgi:flagellum-specific peptidoglycan hydrolase FlgJ
MHLTRDQRLVAIAIHAVKYEKEVGYPPQVLIAQWAIESKWGARPSGRNNLFGMTFNPARHASFSWVATWEELTEPGITALPADERRTITKKEPIVNRRGWWRVELQRRFADYSTAVASIDDKVGLITTAPRYAAAWSGYRANKDIDSFIEAICAAGYATAGYYAQLAQQIAGQKNVARAIAAARAASGIKPTPGAPK